MSRSEYHREEARENPQRQKDGIRIFLLCKQDVESVESWAIDYQAKTAAWATLGVSGGFLTPYEACSKAVQDVLLVRAEGDKKKHATIEDIKTLLRQEDEDEQMTPREGLRQLETLVEGMEATVWEGRDMAGIEAQVGIHFKKTMEAVKLGCLGLCDDVWETLDRFPRDPAILPGDGRGEVRGKSTCVRALPIIPEDWAELPARRRTGVRGEVPPFCEPQRRDEGGTRTGGPSGTRPEVEVELGCGPIPEGGRVEDEDATEPSGRPLRTDQGETTREATIQAREFVLTGRVTEVLQLWGKRAHRGGLQEQEQETVAGVATGVRRHPIEEGRRATTQELHPSCGQWLGARGYL